MYTLRNEAEHILNVLALNDDQKKCSKDVKQGFEKRCVNKGNIIF